MGGKKSVLFFVVLVMGFIAPVKSEALIFINEILADPASGLSGDANNDGVRSGSQDEFIELLNFSEEAIDISGWQLSDAVKPRHVFQSNTILDPFSYLVVFGGGAPVLTDLDWQTASSGSLGLNNNGDQISLFDASLSLVDEVLYGSEAGDNQSLVRTPEGDGDFFVKHSTVKEYEGVLFSPGTGSVVAPNIPPLDLENPDNDRISQSVVPELPVWIYLAGGFWVMFVLKRREGRIYGYSSCSK